MTQQTQLRIPADVKDQFRQMCAKNNTTMTAEIVRFIRGYILSQIKDTQVMKSLSELDMTRRTGLVRDARGTWTPREQLRQNNEWSIW